ncbi:hypothetical protein ACPPVO_16605 [Dactylosporangium sp. McL0621]|uniref:hypothetical protein n=1 Tax=Dactylosporangium sp. McL0621 TaxID=3415678 RepID=UPI003CED3A5B
MAASNAANTTFLFVVLFGEEGFGGVCEDRGAFGVREEPGFGDVREEPGFGGVREEPGFGDVGRGFAGGVTGGETGGAGGETGGAGISGGTTGLAGEPISNGFGSGNACLPNDSGRRPSGSSMRSP